MKYVNYIALAVCVYGVAVVPTACRGASTVRVFNELKSNKIKWTLKVTNEGTYSGIIDPGSNSNYEKPSDRDMFDKITLEWLGQDGVTVVDSCEYTIQSKYEHDFWVFFCQEDGIKAWHSEYNTIHVNEHAWEEYK